MDIQDHSSVQESQVYICNKCGWPFPKPHPSARHRRSHKKICGTIEGYELTDATTALDEEQVSDEYHKTSAAQFPKVMESCNLEKSIGGIGAMSNRSEDEVFSDAAMEFRDGGFGLGRQDSLVHATKSDKDLTPNISFKDCEDASDDVIPIGTEPVMDFLEECREVRGGDKVAESSVDGDGNEVDNMNGNISGGFILHGEYPGEISETTSKSGHVDQESDGRENLIDVVELNGESSCVASEETDDTTSETPLANKVVEVKENDGKSTLDTAISDLSGIAESAKDVDASAYTFKIPTDVIQLDKESDTLGKTFIMLPNEALPDAAEVVTVSDTCFDSNEVFSETETENASVYALSVREDIPVVENADIELEGFKDHNTVKLPRTEAETSEEIIVDEGKTTEDIVKDELVEGKADVIQLDEGSDTLGSFDSSEVFREKESASVYALSVREDIPVVENADIELEGFKDRNTVKLPRSEAVASEEIILDEGKAIEDIVKDELVEGKAYVIQLDKGSDTLGSFVDADADATENEKASEVRSLEEKQLIYDSDDLPNANPTVSHVESARTGVSDIAEDVNTRRSEKEYDVKNSLTSNESTNDSSLSQTNPASNKLEVENSTFEPVSPHHESPVVTKVYLECADEDLRISAADKIEGNEFEKISRDQLKKESIHTPSYPEPTDQHSGSFDDSHTRESGVGASGTSTINLQCVVDNLSIQAQSDAAIGDGQCGSVSVFSTRSDNAALINTGNSPSTGSHPILEPEKANIKEPQVASEQIFDKSDEFEPPSFSTLIEPGGNDQTVAAPEVQNKEDPGAAPLQAGWFPSLTHATNESEGRKKNEEMIEKVTTNWNAEQHIPLKSLLGEAINETRPESPIESSRDEKVVAKDDKGVTVTKVSSILGPESPANHQDDVIGVKRKGKGRPLWVHFACCSSVN